MKRSDVLSLLNGVANAKEICDSILDLHNAEMEEAKKNVDMSQYVKKEDFDKLTAENKELKDGSAKFKDYDELAKFKADTIATQEKAKKIEAVRSLLKSSRANEKVIPLLEKGIDIENVKLDKDGKIVDGDKLLSGLKTDYSDFFAKEEEKGASPANPSPVKPGGEQADPFLAGFEKKGN
jgi:hypothetical protein